jgi:iron complex outermembrane receptor protein
MRTRPTILALTIASLFAATAVQAQVKTEEERKREEAAQRAQRMETLTITGEGDRMGAGQMIQEEAPKARSTTTRAALDKMRATSNPYQGLELLPGVNTFNHDATGLFGGGMRVRGFNSDQMGFTVDGAPVNDSGSFSVFPQEYTDAENMCELFVTQGTPDSDAPHVGASGGNIGIVTCDPKDRFAVKLQQTSGQLKLSKTFVRLDTGKLPFANGWSTFISYSHAESEKWKGPGGANRDHIDVRSVLALPNASRLMVTALYNDSITNNYRNATKAQFAANYNLDFSPTFIGNPTPVAGTRQAPATQPDSAFYGFALNPFKNAIITGKANLNLSPTVKLDIEPYFWYGYGTGGVQQFTLNEGGTFRGGVADANGDGDRLDSVIIYRSSVTKTHRPGATARLSFAVANHRLSTGYWYERARHRQTGPGTRVDNNGGITDLWLESDSNWVRNVDGSPFQQRDQLTISRAGNFFVNDTMGFMEEKLRVDVGVKAAYIDRDYTNYANNGTGQNIDYKAQKRFAEVLPTFGARYQFDSANQVFMNIAKNFKAPGNFSWQGAIIGGVSRVDDINEHLKQETSITADLGFRHYGKTFNFSGSVFNNQFNDRLARRFLPEEGISIDTNVGDGRVRGVELEIGTVPVRGFSAYASVTYTRSRNESDLAVSATNIQPTAGKEFPDTPRWLSGLTLQYAQPLWYANVQAKYTGARFGTLTNDESVPGYTVVGLNAGYLIGNLGFVKAMTLRANVSNLFDKQYLASNAGSGSLFTTNATGTGAQSPFYYAGAPRFSSISVSAEF